MKIYNKIVIDMDTLEVLEEDSFEYDGPLALCEDAGDPEGGGDGDTDAAESDSGMGGDRGDGGGEGGGGDPGPADAGLGPDPNSPAEVSNTAKEAAFEAMMEDMSTQFDPSKSMSIEAMNNAAREAQKAAEFEKQDYSFFEKFAGPSKAREKATDLATQFSIERELSLGKSPAEMARGAMDTALDRAARQEMSVAEQIEQGMMRGKAPSQFEEDVLGFQQKVGPVAPNDFSAIHDKIAARHDAQTFWGAIGPQLAKKGLDIGTKTGIAGLMDLDMVGVAKAAALSNPFGMVASMVKNAVTKDYTSRTELGAMARDMHAMNPEKTEAQIAQEIADYAQAHGFSNVTAHEVEMNMKGDFGGKPDAPSDPDASSPTPEREAAPAPEPEYEMASRAGMRNELMDSMINQELTREGLMAQVEAENPYDPYGQAGPYGGEGLAGVPPMPTHPGLMRGETVIAPQPERSLFHQGLFAKEEPKKRGIF